MKLRNAGVEIVFDEAKYVLERRPELRARLMLRVLFIGYSVLKRCCLGALRYWSKR
jgi:hypothetical protein